MSEVYKNEIERYMAPYDSAVLRKKIKEPSELYEEAYQSGDIKKKIHAIFEVAKYNLGEWFQVKDLSDIEAVRLRNIAEKLVVQSEEEIKLVKKKGMSPRWMIEPEIEVVAQWLYDLYGIQYKDIPHIYMVKNNMTGECYTYEANQEKEAKAKRDELEGGEDYVIFVSPIIPDDFKEYLRRLRENAHLV